jgi:hypothetical protein
VTTMDAADPNYVAARRILLDALVALEAHRDGVIVVGAQAVYLRCEDIDLAVAPYTTDGDLAIDPSRLRDAPPLEMAMIAGDFELRRRPEGHIEPGVWVRAASVGEEGDLGSVDLIVPASVAAALGGRRAARLGVHGKRAANRAVGLEAALVDHSPLLIESMEATDIRRIDAEVAGPAALLVAKAHKVHDRVASGRPARIDDKDAADVLRLMQSTDPRLVSDKLNFLANDPVAGPVTIRAMTYLEELFGRRGRPGTEMASRALRVAMDPDTVAVICSAYVAAVTQAVRHK